MQSEINTGDVDVVASRAPQYRNNNDGRQKAAQYTSVPGAGLWSRWLTRYLDAILRRMHRHAEGVNRRRPECMVSSQCSSPDESRICARHI
jgi:hypothetical protein